MTDSDANVSNNVVRCRDTTDAHTFAERLVFGRAARRSGMQDAIGLALVRTKFLTRFSQ
jgi:hypothetical protein